MTTQEVDRNMQDRFFCEAYSYSWEKDKAAEYWQGLQSPQKLSDGCAPDWSYSVTFHRWGAVVTLADGWNGYTWPLYYYAPENKSKIV